MGSFSLIHWIILAIVIMLLFGGNRFSAMMKDVAKGMKSFKEGLAEDEKPEQRSLPPQGRAPDRPIDVTPEPRERDAAPPRGDEGTGR